MFLTLVQGFIYITNFDNNKIIACLIVCLKNSFIFLKIVFKITLHDHCSLFRVFKNKVK